MGTETQLRLPAAGGLPRRRRAWPGAQSRRTLVSTAAVAGVLLLWQASGSLGWVDPLMLPPPTELWHTLVELTQEGYRQTPLWQHLLTSTLRALVAFVVAILVGVPLGLSMGLSATLSATLSLKALATSPRLKFMPASASAFRAGPSRANPAAQASAAKAPRAKT